MKKRLNISRIEVNCDYSEKYRTPAQIQFNVLIQNMTRNQICRRQSQTSRNNAYDQARALREIDNLTHRNSTTNQYISTDTKAGYNIQKKEQLKQTQELLEMEQMAFDQVFNFVSGNKEPYLSRMKRCSLDDIKTIKETNPKNCLTKIAVTKSKMVQVKRKSKEEQNDHEKQCSDNTSKISGQTYIHSLSLIPENHSSNIIQKVKFQRLWDQLQKVPYNQVYATQRRKQIRKAFADLQRKGSRAKKRERTYH